MRRPLLCEIRTQINSCNISNCGIDRIKKAHPFTKFYRCYLLDWKVMPDLSQSLFSRILPIEMKSFRKIFVPFRVSRAPPYSKNRMISSESYWLGQFAQSNGNNLPAI